LAAVQRIPAYNLGISLEKVAQKEKENQEPEKPTD
jgi:hypothetical protein